ncbi:hypothetical protein [Ramlibacter sp. AN1133]|uniref:hypothetical protein n=1 Tax=Ramlibacter sp. AN1133 TaxID=3133429 RepID=UPI0030C05F58
MFARAILTGAVAISAATAALGDVLPVQRPVLKEGDQWTVARQDALTKATLSKSTRAVKLVESSKIAMSFGARDGVITPDLTILDSGNVVNDVGYQLLRFPLEAEASWEFKTNWQNRSSGNAGLSSFKVKVLGEEKKTTPAGAFDTVKLRAVGSMTSQRFPGKIWSVTLTYWYAPAVKALVRYEWRDNFRDLDVDEELIEFKLAD